jgi:uncharacterized protein (UPF0276 family)
VTDRFGIGWRPELAAGIVLNLDRIDVVEVLADDYLEAPAAELRALRTLGAQVPVLLHGTGLGLASCERVSHRRLDRLARVVDTVRPEGWSEHLAFVRGGGREIGHLAAPPRNGVTVEGTAANLAVARAVIGSAPLVENVATLVEPPGSPMTEPEWVAAVLGESGCDLLLDLHNLHANATNFRFDPLALLDAIRPERIGAVHLAGGQWVSAPAPHIGRRLLDDHRHDVPDPVYGLLEEVARRARGPLTVILERDGAYPRFESLLTQLDRAREAVRRGRASVAASGRASDTPAAPMPGWTVPEAFLARLYTDAEARREFLADPEREALRAGLEPPPAAALRTLDAAGLELAARSFARKRARAAQCRAASIER